MSILDCKATCLVSQCGYGLQRLRADADPFDQPRHRSSALAAMGLVEAFCLFKREMAARGNWLGGHDW
jgi:hypothetical protein